MNQKDLQLTPEEAKAIRRVLYDNADRQGEDVIGIFLKCGAFWDLVENYDSSLEHQKLSDDLLVKLIHKIESWLK